MFSYLFNVSRHQYHQKRLWCCVDHHHTISTLQCGQIPQPQSINLSNESCNYSYCKTNFMNGHSFLIESIWNCAWNLLGFSTRTFSIIKVVNHMKLYININIPINNNNNHFHHHNHNNYCRFWLCFITWKCLI